MTSALQPVAPDVGSVLLVINSYSSATPQCQYLPRTDVALEEYVKTFYQHLRFGVHTALDIETKEELKTSILEYARFAKTVGLDKIAFVFVGHGESVMGIEYIFTNNGEKLQIKDVISCFEDKYVGEKKNKFFFIDACRSGDSIRAPTSPPLPNKTILALSTLSCQVAWYDTGIPNLPRTYGVWSFCFNEAIRYCPYNLHNVMSRVRIRMKKDFEIDQISEYRDTGDCIGSTHTLIDDTCRELSSDCKRKIIVYKKVLQENRKGKALIPKIDVLYDDVLLGIWSMLEKASHEKCEEVCKTVAEQFSRKPGQLPYKPMIGRTAVDITWYILSNTNKFSDVRSLISTIISKFGNDALKAALKALDDEKRKYSGRSIDSLALLTNGMYHDVQECSGNVKIGLNLHGDKNEIKLEHITSSETFLNSYTPGPVKFHGWKEGSVELAFSADADSALLLPSETRDHRNELSELSVTEVTLFKCIEITVSDGTAEFVGSEADFQQLSDRYVKMKNKLEKLATEKDIMSTSSTKAEIHLVEDVETVLSKLINTWKLVQKWHQSKMKGVETLAGAMQTTALSPVGKKMPEEEKYQSEILGMETPSGSMQTSSQSTESDVVETEMPEAQQGILRKIGPISEDILPVTGKDSDSSYLDKTPSDIGLHGVLGFIPNIMHLSVALGVPIDVVSRYRQERALGLDPLLTLRYWRDGRSGVSYPATWHFLLEAIQEEYGPKICDMIEKEVASKEGGSF